jgi:hypothetical protein
MIQDWKLTLWKTTIEVYSDFDPHTMDLSDLVRDAESGGSIVGDVERRACEEWFDVPQNVLDFFDIPEEEEEPE